MRNILIKLASFVDVQFEVVDVKFEVVDVSSRLLLSVAKNKLMFILCCNKNEPCGFGATLVNLKSAFVHMW